MKALKWISDHLLLFVFIIGIFSLFYPGLGSSLEWIVSPVLAIMVLNVSMTINTEDLKRIKKYPLLIVWGVFLQFVPMAIFAALIGKLFSQWGDISTGQLLLGSLPADVSAPLMVYLAGGSTAIGTAMLVIAMALTPFVLPNVLAWFGGVNFKIPVSYLIIELALIIILPVVLGIFINYKSVKVKEKEQIWSGIASLCYIILLFVVVSSNAKSIISLKQFALLILLAEIALNLFGFSLAYLTKTFTKQNDVFLPLLSLVSTKEFGIASAAVETMKLNTTLVIPSAFYAVVQMISSPIMAKIAKKHFSHTEN
ncbi:putative Na+-dependent transporter [Desulfosporosinus acidiphilus SJ4]|uniref:Putative Na+-dependent transporter n=1 Tax=Desulfosporosinus acidiphilus (strain DSM 22704 / JCM 16185 / SJ4) TaxID=646529 RepID=I4D2C3_DESAJ|nr:bile acid:sodium symporter [Desulfosporosinus acidiphilus]AFM39947.1 putative Na+-dependent transporter [Desulfosporosinus acidiphilus SJ4]